MRADAERMHAFVPVARRQPDVRAGESVGVVHGRNKEGNFFYPRGDRQYAVYV